MRRVSESKGRTFQGRLLLAAIGAGLTIITLVYLLSASRASALLRGTSVCDPAAAATSGGSNPPLQGSLAALDRLMITQGSSSAGELDVEAALNSLSVPLLHGVFHAYQDTVCLLKRLSSGANSPVVRQGKIQAKLVKTKPGISMWVYPDHDFVSQSLADPGQGSWEGAELENIAFALKAPVPASSAAAAGQQQQQQPLFVDVGANLGWFSLNAAKLGARVYAFEGMQDNIEMMRASICANRDLAPSITLFPVGLSTANDTCWVVAGDGNLGDGFTACGKKTAAEAEASFSKGYLARGRMLVRRLDDLLQEDVRVMKMDTEGWEINVLGGAKRLFSRSERHRVWFVIVEANRGIIQEEGAHRLMAFLQSAGYRISNVGFKGPWIADSEISRGSVKLDGVNLFAVHKELDHAAVE